MATIVIVHGGWDGGWFWKRPAQELRKRGHEVYTPTLTGLGERVHLGTPDTDLHTHIQDVVNVLIYEDLHDVVLVGHSYGGTVISGVAEKVPERLARVVYLDAFVLQEGQALADLYEGGPVGDLFETLANQHGGGWKVPFPSSESYDPRVNAQPAKTFQTALTFNNPEAAKLPRIFISCTQRGSNPVMAPLFVCAEKARVSGWDYYELAANHNPHITALDETVSLLDQIAANVR